MVVVVPVMGRVFTVHSSCNFYSASLDYLRESVSENATVISTFEHERFSLSANNRVECTSVEAIQSTFSGNCSMGDACELFLLRSYLDEFKKNNSVHVSDYCIDIGLLTDILDSNSVSNYEFLKNNEKNGLRFILKKINSSVFEHKLVQLARLKKEYISSLCDHLNVHKYFFIGLPQTEFAKSIVRVILNSKNGTWIIPYVDLSGNSGDWHPVEEFHPQHFIRTLISDFSLKKSDLSIIGDGIANSSAMLLSNDLNDLDIKHLKFINCTFIEEKTRFIHSFPEDNTICFSDMVSNSRDYVTSQQVIGFCLGILDIFISNCDAGIFLDFLKNPMIKFWNQDNYEHDLYTLETEILSSNKFMGFHEISAALNKQYTKALIGQVISTLEQLSQYSFPVSLAEIINLHSKIIKLLICNHSLVEHIFSNFSLLENQHLSEIDVNSIEEYRGILKFVLHESMKVTRKEKKSFLTPYENAILSPEDVGINCLNRLPYIRNSYLSYILFYLTLLSRRVFIVSLQTEFSSNLRGFLRVLSRVAQSSDCSTFFASPTNLPMIKSTDSIHVDIKKRGAIVSDMPIDALQCLLFNKDKFYNKYVLRVSRFRGISSSLYLSSDVYHRRTIENLIDMYYSFGLDPCYNFIEKSVSKLREPLLYQWLFRFINELSKYDARESKNVDSTYWHEFKLQILDDVYVSFACDKIEFNREDKNLISIFEFDKFHQVKSDECYKGIPIKLLLKAILINEYTNFHVSSLSCLYLEEDAIIEKPIRGLDYAGIARKMKTAIQTFLQDETFTLDGTEKKTSNVLNAFFN